MRRGSEENKEMSMYEFTSMEMTPLESGIKASADSVRRERRIRVLHKALQVAAVPLQKCELKGSSLGVGSQKNGIAFCY